MSSSIAHSYYLWIYCLAMIYIQNSFTTEKSVEKFAVAKIKEFIKINQNFTVEILIKNC